MKARLFIFGYALFFAGAAFSQSSEEGIHQYRYERYNSASTTWQHIIDNTPGDINAWYWLIRSYQQDNQPAKAEAAFNSIPGTLMENPYFHIIRGRLALQKGDTVMAANEWVQSLGTSRKKDPAIQLAIAEANIELEKGNLHFALNMLDEAAKRDDNNAAIYMARGDAYRKLYNASESYRAYVRASELRKNDPVVYYKLGKIYQAQNNPSLFLPYYDKAIAADPNFGPVYYQLYFDSYYKDVNKALGYLEQYIAHTDPDPKTDYLLTDLYYVSKKYDRSIAEAHKLIARDGKNSKPRLYKLLAYSQDALGDSVNALANMKIYLERTPDTSYLSEDFTLMAKLSARNQLSEEAIAWYEKAYQMEKDPAKKAEVVRKLIAYHKKDKKYDQQAYWFGQLNALKVPLNNVDIFNWGVASYNAKEYPMADSIFGMYAAKYPDQTFGYYWRARSNAAMDTAMESGIAIPHYESLIAVAEKDTLNANNRKWLIQAYGYIAAFKVNKEKMYNDALVYYDKILALDPANGDAEKYKEMLEKMIDSKSTADKADKAGNN